MIVVIIIIINTCGIDDENLPHLSFIRPVIWVNRVSDSFVCKPHILPGSLTLFASK